MINSIRKTYIKIDSKAVKALEKKKKKELVICKIVFGIVLVIGITAIVDLIFFASFLFMLIEIAVVALFVPVLEKPSDLYYFVDNIKEASQNNNQIYIDVESKEVTYNKNKDYYESTKLPDYELRYWEKETDELSLEVDKNNDVHLYWTTPISNKVKDNEVKLTKTTINQVSLPQTPKPEVVNESFK